MWKHKIIAENQETKSYFFENINKIKKPLAKLTKKRERGRRYKLQLSEMKEGTSLKTPDPMEITRTVKNKNSKGILWRVLYLQIW